MFDARCHVPMRGAQHLMLGEIKPISDNGPEAGMFGRLYRFVYVDKSATWFNVARHDEATSEELSRISLPDELRPNTEMFDFVFYPKGHSLYVNTRSGNKVNGKRHGIGIGQVLKLLKTLALLPAIEQRFGAVEITVLPDQEQLDRILSIHKLNKLVIEVSKPNPDELGQAQARVFDRLSGMKARKLKQELIAEKNESIAVDDDTRTLAKVPAFRLAGLGGGVISSQFTGRGLPSMWHGKLEQGFGVQTTEVRFALRQ